MNNDTTGPEADALTEWHDLADYYAAGSTGSTVAGHRWGITTPDWAAPSPGTPCRMIASEPVVLAGELHPGLLDVPSTAATVRLTQDAAEFFPAVTVALPGDGEARLLPWEARTLAAVLLAAADLAETVPVAAATDEARQ